MFQYNFVIKNTKRSTELYINHHTQIYIPYFICIFIYLRIKQNEMYKN